MNNWREQKPGSRWEKVGLKIEADVKRPSQTLNNEGDYTEMGVTCWIIDVNPEIVEEWLWGLFYEGDEMLLPFNLQDSLRQNPLSAGGEHLSPHSQESIHGQTSSRRCTQYPPTRTKIPNYRQNFHVAYTPDLLPLRSLKLFISILWLGSHTIHSPILPRRMHRHPLLHTKEVIRVYRWGNIYRLTSSHSFHWRLAQGWSFVAVIWQILRTHNGRLRRRYPTTGFFFPFIPLRSHRTHGCPAPCLNDSRVHRVAGRPVRLHRAMSFLVSGAAWGSCWTCNRGVTDGSLGAVLVSILSSRLSVIYPLWSPYPVLKPISSNISGLTQTDLIRAWLRLCQVLWFECSYEKAFAG